MKFTVDCNHRTEEMIKNNEWSTMSYDFINDWVEAGSEEEAVEIAMRCLEDTITDNGFSTKVENDTIHVYDEEDNLVEEYYNFVATKVEQYDENGILID